MPLRNKAILFDFDGTIAETEELGASIFNSLAKQYGFGQITRANVDELRSQGPRGAMKTLSIPLLRVPTVMRTLRQGIRTALPTLAVAPGMRSTIKTLKERGYKLAIVTTQSEENVHAFLKNHHMEYFDYFQTGIGLFGKARAIKKLVSREELGDYELAFVGDEIRDIEAAKKNGIKVIGVTWGVNSREGLEGAGPDYIVSNAGELVKLFD